MANLSDDIDLTVSADEVKAFLLANEQEVVSRCDNKFNYNGVGAWAYQREKNKTYYYGKMAVEMIRDERVKNAIIR